MRVASSQSLISINNEFGDNLLSDSVWQFRIRSRFELYDRIPLEMMTFERGFRKRAIQFELEC